MLRLGAILQPWPFSSGGGTVETTCRLRTRLWRSDAGRRVLCFPLSGTHYGERTYSKRFFHISRIGACADDDWNRADSSRLIVGVIEMFQQTGRAAVAYGFLATSRMISTSRRPSQSDFSRTIS